MSERKERLRKEAKSITRLIIFITTYNRPKMLLSLLKDIIKNKDQYSIDLYVIDDYSDEDYSEVLSFIKDNNWNFIKNNSNYGKKQFYLTFNKMFDILKKDHEGYSRSPSIPSAKYYYFLQDDLVLKENFFIESISIWERLPKNNLCSLNLMVDEKRQRSSCWTGVYPVDVGYADDTGWVDCIFMCNHNMMKQLNWKLDPVSSKRWKKDKSLSSGVGKQMSCRLFANQNKMYRVKSSLVFHIGIDSKLNKDRGYAIYNATAKDQDQFQDNIMASMASIPSRVGGLEKVVNSLLHQVSQLNLYLNNYKSIPYFLKNNKKIKVFMSQDYKDLGDIGKFFFLKDYSGYYFSCDDDIIYPKDYVKNTINQIEYFERKAIVGYHGILLNSNFKSYYESRKSFHFRKNVEYSRSVNILGTGVMAFHTDTAKFDINIFKKENMADIWMGIFAKNNKIPMICLRHNKKYFSLSEESQKLSIHKSSTNNDSSTRDTLTFQNNQIIKNMPWKIYYV